MASGRFTHERNAVWLAVRPDATGVIAQPFGRLAFGWEVRSSQRQVRSWSNRRRRGVCGDEVA